MYVQDTIAAISTPQGQGGIGIVRISGPSAADIGERIFKAARPSKLSSHRLYYGKAVHPLSGEDVDEAMLVLMRAPHSYTREDVLEIHCHGGLLVVDRVLSLALLCGARLAAPGEFTRRAFLNGRIDLLEAEAVMDVIASRSEAALSLARSQQGGVLSQSMREVQGNLRHALALVEAYIDFPEDDLGESDHDAVNAHVSRARTAIQQLIAGFDEGRVVRDGIAVLIAGKPNAGKSSLLNRLLGEERAIVTHIAGTTRDIIEETAVIGGLAVRLLDTAGIRHTDDPVEQAGIERARECIPLADLILFVLDATRQFDVEDALILDALAGKQVLVVSNKCDMAHPLLPPEVAGLPHCAVSSMTGEGIELLKELIRTSFVRQSALDSREFVAISRARHRDALVLADEALERFCSGITSSRELETLALDLRDALAAVGQVTGETVPDDLLDIIFSSFCIGK